MSYKGEILELLPQQKDVCVKFSTGSKLPEFTNAKFYCDNNKLYFSDLFVKKGWKMFISRPLNRIFILNGIAKIKIININGNITIKATDGKNVAEGSVYVKIPFICTSICDYVNQNKTYVTEFKVKKIYKSLDQKSAFILGCLIFDKDYIYNN